LGVVDALLYKSVNFFPPLVSCICKSYQINDVIFGDPIDSYVTVLPPVTDETHQWPQCMLMALYGGGGSPVTIEYSISRGACD
jgi:hypothetical protein